VTEFNQLIAEAKTDFDLTKSDDQESLYTLTEKLLTFPESTSDGFLTAAREPNVPLEFRLAVMLVRSRQNILRITRPIKIAVVFAMWGEHNRLLPKSDTNPNGEDCLRIKLTQLEWITSGTPINWVVYAVDDGCPNGSGKIAQDIVNTDQLGNTVKVHFLEQALPTDTGPLKALKSADDSRKAGAVILGCQQAISDGMDAVIYTDADSSVHLGQIGLLLRPFFEDGYRVVLGNRKHPDAVLVKQEGRWGIGIKVLRHMQRMVGQAIFSRNILDTQAAFKLYECNLLQKIISNPTVFDFSFDTDWLLAAISMDEALTTVPFAFIDSFAESASITQGPMTTWESLLKGLVQAVRRHGVAHSEAMAQVLDEEIRSSVDLDAIIHHLPPELAAAKPESLGDPAVISPEALQIWIQERKAAAR
jgi:hypothetical protein